MLGLLLLPQDLATCDEVGHVVGGSEPARVALGVVDDRVVIVLDGGVQAARAVIRDEVEEGGCAARGWGVERLDSFAANEE